MLDVAPTTKKYPEKSIRDVSQSAVETISFAVRNRVRNRSALCHDMLQAHRSLNRMTSIVIFMF